MRRLEIEVGGRQRNGEVQYRSLEGTRAWECLCGGRWLGAQLG